MAEKRTAKSRTGRSSSGEISPVVLEQMHSGLHGFVQVVEQQLDKATREAKGLNECAFSALDELIHTLQYELGFAEDPPNLAVPTRRPEIPREVLLGLRRTDTKELKKVLDSIGSEIGKWSPPPRKPSRRRPIFLGNEKECREAESEYQCEIDRKEEERLVPVRQAIEAIKTPVRELLNLLRKLRGSLEQELTPMDTEGHQDNVGVSGKQFVITKRPSCSYLIKFSEEIGEFKGVNIDRFVKLCRDKKVSSEELARDLEAIKNSKSIVSSEQIPAVQGSQQISDEQQLDAKDVRRLKKHLKEEREDIELRLRASPSEEERGQLEERMKQVVKQQNSLQRIPESEVKTARRAVEKSFERLSQACKDDMPNFAEHISNCWDYDALRNEYMYRCPSGIGWEFVNF